MSVSSAEAMYLEETATEAELGAYMAAWDAAQEPAFNPDQYRDLFLVPLPQHPRRVPVVAIVGMDRHGARALDGVWVFIPGRQALYRNRGDAFDRTQSAMRAGTMEAA